jgi:hypothetical protein
MLLSDDKIASIYIADKFGDFFNLLTEEVKTYKNFLETANNEWIVKGFIDEDKNI